MRLVNDLGDPSGRDRRVARFAVVRAPRKTVVLYLPFLFVAQVFDNLACGNIKKEMERERGRGGGGG